MCANVLVVVVNADSFSAGVPEYCHSGSTFGGENGLQSSSHVCLPLLTMGQASDHHSIANQEFSLGPLAISQQTMQCILQHLGAFPKMLQILQAFGQRRIQTSEGAGSYAIRRGKDGSISGTVGFHDTTDLANLVRLLLRLKVHRANGYIVVKSAICGSRAS